MDYAGIFIMNRDKLNHIGISLLMIGLKMRSLVKKRKRLELRYRRVDRNEFELGKVEI